MRKTSVRRQRILLWTILFLSLLFLLFIYYLTTQSNDYKLILGQNLSIIGKLNDDSSHHLHQRWKDSFVNINLDASGTYERKEKVIILWTPFFGKNDYVPKTESNSCKMNNCIFTSNRSLIGESDAVMFHLRDLDLKDMPSFKRTRQRWILLHHESPPHTPNLLTHLEGLINWTATYRTDSDIFLSPSFKKRDNPQDTFIPSVDLMLNKTRMVVWIASNCHTPSNRETFVKEMRKTITVDVFGDCGDHECLPKMSTQCLSKLSKEYRFILAFENSICKDYITEKYFNVLNQDIIPIVFGGSDYAHLVPPKSYIDALSFESPRHLAQYLIYLSKHQDQYNQYLTWKKEYQINYEHYSCQICRKLNHHKEQRKVWNNLNKWWFEEAKCKSWTKPD